MSKRIMFLLAALLGFALVASACGSDSDDAASSSSSAPATTAASSDGGGDDAPDLGGQTVTVAIENAYLPFNYIDAATGEAGGWDYDAIDEICARINCAPDYQEFAWDLSLIHISEPTRPY